MNCFSALIFYALGFNPTSPFVSMGLKPPKDGGRGIYPLAKAQRQVWNIDLIRQAKAAVFAGLPSDSFVPSLRDGEEKERCFFLPSDNPSGIKIVNRLCKLDPQSQRHLPCYWYSSQRDGSSVEKKYQSKISSRRDATVGWVWQAFMRS